MVKAQQRLFSDISNELRKRLTRLQLSSALLRLQQGKSKELNLIEIETYHLDSMINDLFILSSKQHKTN